MPITNAPCWCCKQPNPTHLLADVRLMRCPNVRCQAELPGMTHIEYAGQRHRDGMPLRTRGAVNLPAYEPK